MAIIDSDAGGTGSIANEPSPSTVRVFSGENGTGNLLGTIDVRALGPVCSGDPTGQYCNGSTGDLFFDGTARSIDFGSTANQMVFGNITFGNLAAPGTGGGTVPEPTSLAWLGAAFVA